MNFLMNELSQMGPVLFVQAGDVASVDVGKVVFSHGNCSDTKILDLRPKSQKATRSRQPGSARWVSGKDALLMSDQ
jgi:hypothetical protein